MRFRVYLYCLPGQIFRNPQSSTINGIPNGEWEISFISSNSKKGMTPTYVLLTFVGDNLVDAQGWETRKGHNYRLSIDCIEAFRKVALQLPGPDRDFEIQFP